MHYWPSFQPLQVLHLGTQCPAQAEVPNCYKMTACNEMADPITGSQSGAWSCEDPEIFCGAIGDIPAYDDKKTVWTCDHNVHPYGDATKTIFQDTTCRTT